MNTEHWLELLHQGPPPDQRLRLYQRICEQVLNDIWMLASTPQGLPHTISITAYYETLAIGQDVRLSPMDVDADE